MKLKLLMLLVLAFGKCQRVKSADIFDDQPKILVNDGNLVFESAESKNVTVRLKGKSRFFINQIDVLESLRPSNGSPSDAGGSDNANKIRSLEVQVAKLKTVISGQQGIMNRLDRLELGIPANATIPAGTQLDRNRVNALNRRIAKLELKVANLTERLTHDHCKSYPCKNGGTCFNMFETFRCECLENYEGPTCELDVNECSRYADTDLGCQNQATCFNTIGSYECRCTNQWQGKNCNRKKMDCLQVPQFEICGHGTCVEVNNKLGYSCICEQGWRQSNETKSCTVDVDECNEMRPHCSIDPSVFCINTPGSFLCGPCPKGYRGNGYTCEDIDECDNNNNGGCSISPKVECINTRGSSRCGNCPLGYEGDGRTCTPSSLRPNFECVDSSICSENAQCVQYPNSAPTCTCKPGYRGNGYGANGCIYTGLDACAALRCKNGGTCVKNGTSAYCECPTGFVKPLCQRENNPCDLLPCLNGGNCTTSRGGRRYTCWCMQGFTGANCQNQVRKCGGMRETENGTLRYPENPLEMYSHNSRCAWLIKTNHTKVLNITFTKFVVEQSNDCRFDWLQIHDGRSSSSYMIGRFCGNNFPKGGNFMTTHNLLYLWFRSDNSTAQDGFELSWESIDPVCGGEMNITTHGTISSPGSPGKYPMNRDCEWFITGPPGKRIQFHFYTLMIEAHATCSFDFVEVHSGLGSETPSLGKFCNTTNPPPLLTPSHTATIHFHSDGDSNDVGFQIAFSVVEGIPGCGGVYTAARGDVLSPTNIADGKYKHNMMCDYVIQMPKDSRVRIEFKKFSLEESSSCKFDKIEIFEGSVFDEEQMIGRYCGTNMPPILTSQTNLITVKFTSDWSSSEEGFQFQYQLVCGGIFTADNGKISSPNYPQPYAGERACEYDISAPLGKVIVLNVEDLDIEMHSICEFDNLEIFDGFVNDNATSLGRFCGQTKPPGPFVSSFNHLRVHFNSDASVNGRGFVANYSFVDVECGGIVKDSHELIKSPMETDGNGVYKHNSNCRWLVYAPPGHVIQMNFIKFDLEKDSACKYDFIQIFNNGSGRGEAMGPFCGSNAPKIVTTLDNIATILFATDSSNSKEGFTISLVFIDANKLCGANYFSSQGIIRSPGKLEYLPNKDCEWVITVPNGQQIELTFNYFEMENHADCRFDKLEIRNGGNSFAPLIGKFCGETVPAPMKSFGSQLYIKFTSDSSRGGKGFEIEWDGTSTGCGGHITTTKGSISSPNYPESYTHNAQCEWSISVNEGSTIEIIFTDLDLETQSECKYDYLEIFDGIDASTRSLGKFCSSEKHPMHLETIGNHALIRMSTDDTNAGRGFFLKYSTTCNRTIYMDSGVIESPNFPNNYPNNLDCAWTIVVSKGNKINMQFSHFYMENDNRFHNETNEHICKYDFLEISDLDFESKAERGQKVKYCNGAPDPRISLSDAVVLVFHSDPSATSTGFRMEWYVEGCGGILNRPEGTLTSPNYPKKYAHELTCIWEINVEYGYKIEITINDLDMEKTSNCEYDYLMIAYDRSFNESIVKMCHTSHKLFPTDAYRLFVKFNSDDSNNGKGFNLTYRSILSDCGGKFIGTNGVISTPGFPSENYENNKHCMWNIRTDQSHSLMFQFIDFDLETSDNCTKDYIEILDPVFNKLLWKGCGSQMPNQTVFKSERNQLNVRLVTDNSTTAKGFKGNFTNACGGRIVTQDSGEFQYRINRDENECYWTIVAEDPSKKILLTFTYSNIFLETQDGCLSKIEVFEGESVKGALKTSFCGTKTPPAIYSNGNSLTVKLNSSFVNEFDIHYTVLDNACGATYSKSTHGEFASPNYPESSPLNTYCIWKIRASAGHKMSLTFNSFDIASTPNCNDNYLEVRKIDQNGPLVGLFCGNQLPANVEPAQSFWIKYQTDGQATSAGFIAVYKYSRHSNLEGPVGTIESPNYPKFFTTSIQTTYRINVKQGSVIRIEFPTFYLDEEDDDECFAFIKVYNGYDETAPLLQDEMCSDSPEPLTSQANVVFIEFVNNHMSKTKFQMNWKEMDKEMNNTNLVDGECSDKIILLKANDSFVNITSPGFPNGYGNLHNCTWTIMAENSQYHPIVVFRDIDLEDTTECVGDFVRVLTDRDDGSWKEHEKLCSMDLRERRYYDGTPNIKLQFRTDYGINRTGFYAYTYLKCGGKMTENEGIIDYSARPHIRDISSPDCVWNITVRRGKIIQFEFIELKLSTFSDTCSSYVTIRNGIDEASPYLGSGQYCGDVPLKVPPTSSNRAFVKFKTANPTINSFKLRYYEVQHDCGGQHRLSFDNNSVIINSPNFPKIPPAHIDCTWTIIAPAGKRMRIDFIERFDLTFDRDCKQEYVELRDGLTAGSTVLGTFCGYQTPATKRSRSNILMMKFYTDIAYPRNGFQVNISIDVCGGTYRSYEGFLTSSNYPGLGAYPSNTQCDYRIIGYPNHIFNIMFADIDLPPQNATGCDLERDHIKIYSIVSDYSANTTESLFEIATICGNVLENSTYSSFTTEVLIRLITFGKTKDLYKGFKLTYNASRLSCGGDIEAESGFITSPGYPTRSLTPTLCEWKLTVPKGRQVKIEFEDLDLMASNLQLQRIGIYNDFSYSNRMMFITGNASTTEPLFSSDNRMMVTLWIRATTSNRGFKLKFSSATPTICIGGLNDPEGGIYPPIELNLTSYSCDYIRELKPIYGTSLTQGTIAYYFKNLSVGKKIMNCNYATTVINVRRQSGQGEAGFMAKICGNTTAEMTVTSPFPDVIIEIRQNPFFGPVNFTMTYKTHKCGGILKNYAENYIRNLPANTSSEAVVDCAWSLEYDEGTSISLIITNMTLTLPCDDEYIEIYNGPTVLSPLIGKFCGSEVSKPIVSQRNNLYVQYHTTDFVGRSKNSVFEIKIGSTSFGCGGILTKRNFVFTTPNYDKPYPANSECIWEIRSDPGYHIGLIFNGRFFIEESDNCTKDSVEVFDFVDHEWISLGKRCGRDVPKPFNSTSDKMKIVFRSDNTSNADGFSAVWSQNCGGLYKVDKEPRIISSPGYPKLYGPQLYCNYTFNSPPGTYINIEFLDFSIEPTSIKCTFDNVTIYKSLDFLASVIKEPTEKVGTYCGAKSPAKLRYKDAIAVVFQTDRWVERKGFQFEYKLENCGAIITNSTMITSPTIVSSTTTYLGSMECIWNITAPVDKKIVVKFEKFEMEMSEYCSFDYVEIFNGTQLNDTMRLAKICGNLTNSIKPIIINSNEAVIRFKTDQTNDLYGFSAAIFFRPQCDDTIVLTADKPTFTLDRANKHYSDSMECAFNIVGESLSLIQMTINEVHLNNCTSQGDVTCNCNYLEVHDGNGPFSETIGRHCGHNLINFTSTGSSLYVLFVTGVPEASTGFKATFSLIQSPCGSHPYQNFTGNETTVTFLMSPTSGLTNNYLPNIRCTWIFEGQYSDIFDVSFNKFNLENTENCKNDSLTIEDNNVKEFITEGLGTGTVFRGKSRSTSLPSFYTGIAGPTAPHIYCGSDLPPDFYSESSKIRISFKSNSENEFSGFNISIKTMKACSRNFTALTGRMVSSSDLADCKTTIKVPENYTISVFFHRFFFYEQDCTKSFLKIFDGDFESGTLLKTLCGYAMPDPIFSTKNQLSLFFHFESGVQYYLRGNYDIMYVATDKGQGCGGEIYNYGGIFTSPLYPASNRTFYDCAWTLTVPQNLKVAIRFATFDMGSKLMCESDFVEFLEENDNGEMRSIKKYCGEDDPAVYLSARSKMQIHYVQTVNFAGTGWVINFIGVDEGSKPQNW